MKRNPILDSKEYGRWESHYPIEGFILRVKGRNTPFPCLFGTEEAARKIAEFVTDPGEVTEIVHIKEVSCSLVEGKHDEFTDPFS